MAKARMLSRSIATSVDLASLSCAAELLWYRMIPFIDREGRLPGNPRKLHMMVAPAHPTLNPTTIEGALAELAGRGMLRRYENAGQQYLHFPTFAKYQQGMKKDREAPSELPAPPEYSGPSPDLVRGTPPEVYIHSEVEVEVQTQTAASPPESVEQPSLALVLPDKPAVPQPPPAVLAAVTALGRVGRASAEAAARVDRSRSLRQLIFAYWQQVHRHPNARWKPDGVVDRKIRQRLMEDDGDPNRCLYAIDGAKHDDWLMGKSGGRKYDGLETLFRDEAITTRLAECKPGFGRGEQHPFLRDIDEQMGGAAVQA